MMGIQCSPNDFLRQPPPAAGIHGAHCLLENPCKPFITHRTTRKQMPSNDVHTFFSERVTGLRCQRTHRIMDSFSSVKGKQHRQWFHTPTEAAAVARVVEGAHCVPAALNHLYVDKMYAEPSSKIVLEMLRLAEKAPPEPAPHTPQFPKRNGCIVKPKAFKQS